jgi:hypothetical protein
MISTSQPVKNYQRDLSPEPWHLVRKLVLLGLLAMALSLGLVILLHRSGNLPVIIFNIFADASLGLFMGLGSRLVLRRRNGFVRTLAATALSIAGLAFLGFLTASRNGIGPLDLSLVTVHWLDRVHVSLWLPLALGRRTMDLLDLAHVVIAVDTSWLALRAWTRQSRPAGRRATFMSTTGPDIAPAPARMTLWVAGQSVQQDGVRRASHAGPLPDGRGNAHPVISLVRAAQRPAQSRLRRRKPFGRRPEVQLAAFAEHRCPFCLEDIKRNDARGFVECPICHTLHHQDCWDITGSCQVPHLNT